MKLIQNEKLLNMSTRMIVKRAREKNIPVIVLNAPHNYIQLGLGCRSEKIKSTRTTLSNPATNKLADNKELTNELLKVAGIPTPYGAVAITFMEARNISRNIGWPVVMKPARDTAHGNGVSIKIKNDRQLRSAFSEAKKFGRRILIEKYLSGEEYRFIVINYRLIAITKRVPAHIVGDGKHSIQQLIDITNCDSRRGGMFGSILTKIDITKETRQLLKERGYSLRSIPPSGETVYTTLKSNIGLGGVPIDETNNVSDALKTFALEAAHIIGLPVAGIDMIIPDPKGTKGTVIEVNGVPGIYPQLFPVQGKPRDTTGALIDSLFPRPENAYIPLYYHKKKLTRAAHIADFYNRVPRLVRRSLNGREWIDKRPRQKLLGYLINSSVVSITL